MLQYTNSPTGSIVAFRSIEAGPSSVHVFDKGAWRSSALSMSSSHGPVSGLHPFGMACPLRR